MVDPYLPDIIKDVIGRVNTSFSNRVVDPFSAFFDKGILSQVRRSVYLADNNFPLVWLVYIYKEVFDSPRYYSIVPEFKLIIALPTLNTYTQQQRDDISYKPRLLPLADQIQMELNRDHSFSHTGPVKCTKELLPYWGAGDVNGTDQANLFSGKFIDAISLTFSNIVIKKPTCLIFTYPILDTKYYPIMGATLTFYDDLELIVDGGNPNDPVAGTNSIVIPFLLGKNYTVEQRGEGELRQKRNAEFIPDLTNGGFAFSGNLKFTAGDTYFIKIRPQYL